jgi:hypothetical protein
MKDNTMLQRIKRIIGYAAKARFNATVEAFDVGYIPRQRDINSPYTYSPVHSVFRMQGGQLAILVETMHRRYDAFAVPAEMVQATEAACIGTTTK